MGEIINFETLKNKNINKENTNFKNRAIDFFTEYSLIIKKYNCYCDIKDKEVLVCEMGTTRTVKVKDLFKED